ncbi:Peroxidase 27 [Vitis vinifera]|uniref:Peroxidase 27 n=1 Tax=Vitis vinifera TaxID=29760 RepID=A0A438CQM1_VITVI|nr:Peroxidase 27 [Vitis vinifera]
MSSQKLFSAFFLQVILATVVLGMANVQCLKLGFYKKTCPAAEDIVRKTTAQYISKAPTLAAPLLRMHFMTVLLGGYHVIDAAKSAVEKKCPGVVSCADILALVARDAVSMINGPYWKVPTGRRDGKVSVALEALINLPPPFANITQLKSMFHSKGLSVKDLAVLSGGHTIGISHCSSFTNRLYNFTGKEMDPGSFKTFDGDYYTMVAKRRGLFQSDAALLDDVQTRKYVNFTHFPMEKVLGKILQHPWSKWERLEC